MERSRRKMRTAVKHGAQKRAESKGKSSRPKKRRRPGGKAKAAGKLKRKRSAKRRKIKGANDT